MPREMRQIFLNNNELVHALNDYRALHTDFLPVGAISHVEAETEHVSVKIDMRYLDNRHLIDFKVGYEKLREVLVQFCIERQIKLPMAGDKRARDARGDGEEVALDISLGREDAADAMTGRLRR